MAGEPGESPEKTERAAQELHELFDSMEKMHDVFKALQVGGFSELQALRIVAFMMMGNHIG